MQYRISFEKESRFVCSSGILIIKIFILGVLISLSQISVQAQNTQDAQYSKPSWRFGVAGGANFNFHRGSTHQLNSDFTPPAIFHDGDGVGLYLAPLLEFHPASSIWGFMLQSGYDSRKGTFDQVETPCNCPADLNTNLSYFTVEPSLRFAPFKSGFYLYAGPRLAFNLDKAFTYQQGINPDFPEQIANPDVNGDFSDMRKTIISMQIGAGLDISLSAKSSQTKFLLSPFVSFQPYFGQDPRSVETWNLTTLRVGAALKFGRGRKIIVPVQEPVSFTKIAEPDVQFMVYAPKNISSERTVREQFPLRNYVFFDLGSTAMPNRYKSLKKEQVKDFKEDRIEFATPENLSGRSDRQMMVYYNVLNILGDRMTKNPSTTIKLVGSSEKGPEDGKEMAESVKLYLVDVYGITASRISTDGRTKPTIPSEQPGGTIDLVMLREGDRRVTIESTSPALLMEFQSGPEAPLKPIEIITVQEAPIESYVTFDANGGTKAFSSWSMEIRDEKENILFFGPYTQDKISLPGKSILGTRPEGNYKVTMIGKTKSGQTVKKEATTHLVLWTPPKDEEVMRFSIIYEFNRSKAVSMYEKYLTDVVTPKIPQGGTVIIHGHTDIIGGEDYNQNLSLARANDVRSIIENSLSKAGRSDVKFEVYGFGEDQKQSPFDNKFPEERFYNRTVILDIVPQ